MALTLLVTAACNKAAEAEIKRLEEGIDSRDVLINDLLGKLTDRAQKPEKGCPELSKEEKLEVAHRAAAMARSDWEAAQRGGSGRAFQSYLRELQGVPPEPRIQEDDGDRFILPQRADPWEDDFRFRRPSH